MLRRFTVLLILFALTPAFAQDTAKAKTESKAKDSSSFALIEIFTSEGCSSCPRMDDYVNKIYRQARKQKQPIVLLSWHVDYWNRLRTRHGVWADPYSSKASTLRQKRYVKAVPAPGRLRGKLVTPQILLDGRHPQQYGKKKFPVMLQEQLKAERKAAIKLTRTKDGVDWSVTGAADNSEILIALVQRDIKQKVTKGENYNRELEHENVVRWHAISLLSKTKTKGSTEITLPKGTSAESAGIVAIVQKSDDMTVQAVKAIDWKEEEEK